MTNPLGVDVGRIFADFRLRNERMGETKIAKVPSTSEHSQIGVLNSVVEICDL